jgi:phospholipid/cholesterol/gamma-HCH transport system substrate-binding protein
MFSRAPEVTPTAPMTPAAPPPAMPVVPSYSMPSVPSLPSVPYVATPSVPAIPYVAAPAPPAVPHYAAPTIPTAGPAIKSSNMTLILILGGLFLVAVILVLIFILRR